MPTTSGDSRRLATRDGSARPGPTRPTSSSWSRPTATCRSRAISGQTRIDAQLPRPPAGHRRSTPAATSSRRPRASAPPSMQNVALEGHELLRNKSGRTPEERVHDLALDGVDAEILFPNKGLTIWATQDAIVQPGDVPGVQRLGLGDLRAVQRPARARMACVATADLDGAIAEIQRCAALGFRGLVPAVQARVRAAQPRGPELQPPRVRAAVGLHRGRRSARSRSTSRPAATLAPPAAKAAR